jgi:hypothetical protein
VLLLAMKENEKGSPGADGFSASEQRAARAERIKVSEAEPYGWTARSEREGEHYYHLFCEPRSRSLVCTCADFTFRGNAEPGFECKHVTAVLKFIGKQYLRREYSVNEPKLRIA